jgi:hypothetical protein
MSRRQSPAIIFLSRDQEKAAVGVGVPERRKEERDLEDECLDGGNRKRTRAKTTKTRNGVSLTVGGKGDQIELPVPWKENARLEGSR